MKSYTNIYDVDGELLRAAEDTKALSLEEARKRIEKYQEKVKELDEKDPKFAIYTTYIRNLMRYIFNLYANTPKDQLVKEFNTKSTEEQVKEAIENLKNELNDTETEGSTDDKVQRTAPTDIESDANTELGDDQTRERSISNIPENRPKTQSDLLVERDNVNIVMDEYVDFEEV